MNDAAIMTKLENDFNAGRAPLMAAYKAFLKNKGVKIVGGLLPISDEKLVKKFLKEQLKAIKLHLSKR